MLAFRLLTWNKLYEFYTLIVKFLKNDDIRVSGFAHKEPFRNFKIN